MGSSGIGLEFNPLSKNKLLKFFFLGHALLLVGALQISLDPLPDQQASKALVLIEGGEALDYKPSWSEPPEPGFDENDELEGWQDYLKQEELDKEEAAKNPRVVVIGEGGGDAFIEYEGEDLLSKGKRVSLSSRYGSRYDADKCIDNDINTFCHTKSQSKPWFQVDLGKVYFVTKVHITNRNDCCGGRSNSLNIMTYDLQRWAYCKPKTFHKVRRNGQTGIITCDKNGRFVRVRSTKSGYLNLAEVQVWGRGASASKSAGKEDKECKTDLTEVLNWRHFHTSSQHHYHLSRYDAKMHAYHHTAWCARKHNSKKESVWIGVDLGGPFFVAQVRTLGRRNYPQWVTTYKLSYSLNGRSWKYYDGGNELSGNVNQHSVITHHLKPKIKTRWVRLYPWTWHNWRCMRFQLLGCVAEVGAVGKKGDKGVEGYLGNEGKKGKKGSRGQTGIRGLPGDKGDPGDPGSSGNKGPIGKQGPLGSKGEPGLDGIVGPAGPPGAPGKIGAPGEVGPDGDIGLEGEQGPIGPPGKDGKNGAKGEMGETGAKGDRGQDGMDGTDGAPGLKGAIGKQGAPGKPGLRGDPGGKGPPGPKGVDGLDGEEGDRGEEGHPGGLVNKKQIAELEMTVDELGAKFTSTMDQLVKSGVLEAAMRWTPEREKLQKYVAGDMVALKRYLAKHEKEIKKWPGYTGPKGPLDGADSGMGMDSTPGVKGTRGRSHMKGGAGAKSGGPPGSDWMMPPGKPSTASSDAKSKSWLSQLQAKVTELRNKNN